jgi:hypothetical protein
MKTYRPFVLASMMLVALFVTTGCGGATPSTPANLEKMGDGMMKDGKMKGDGMMKDDKTMMKDDKMKGVSVTFVAERLF